MERKVYVMIVKETEYENGAVSVRVFDAKYKAVKALEEQYESYVERIKADGDEDNFDYQIVQDSEYYVEDYDGNIKYEGWIEEDVDVE